MFLHPHHKAMTIGVLWGAVLVGPPALATAQGQESSPVAVAVPVLAKAGEELALSRPELVALNAALNATQKTPPNGVLPTLPVRLRVWGFEVYDARLWTPRGFRHSQYVQHPFALELQYLRRLDGADIASRSVDEMRRVGPISDAQAQSCRRPWASCFPMWRKATASRA